MKNNRYDANKMDQERRSMKIMKAKSMTAIILFLALLLGLSGIVSAQIKQQIMHTDNTYEDSYPQTAGGYVVWQGRIDGDWEIFLYNANDKTVPVIQITSNDYDDTSPKTDGNYVIWTAGSAPYGEIFIYDITTTITTQITANNAYDTNFKVFNGLVVWVSKPVGENGLEPGEIFLYDIANETVYNVSALVPSVNYYDDFGLRFDGQQVFWNREFLLLGSAASYLYDLTTGSTYRYYTPEEGDENEDFVPYLEDLATGETKGMTLIDMPQEDGDFLVFASYTDGIGSDREIVLRDRKNKRGGRITDNDIEDSQPTIGGNILAWRGDTGDAAEIYIYEIPPFYADAGHDLYLASEHVSQTTLQGVVKGETDGLQYRWMKDGIILSGWQSVIDGRAPLSLGPFTGLALGHYPFSLEVTNGTITVDDEVVLSVENWHLTPVSPVSGFEMTKKAFKKAPPVFVWNSRGYEQFKIQFTITNTFEEQYTLTLPKDGDTWLNETSITLDKEQASDIVEKLEDGDNYNAIYWRVLALDRYGNEKISETRHIVISK
jgi:hypothetical protein